MAYRASDVYTEVCDLLLEPGGLQFVYTESAFLRDLRHSLVELCQDTGFAVDLLAVETPIALPDISLPDTVVDVHEVIYRHRALFPNSSFDVGQYDAKMDSSFGSPEEWYRSHTETGEIRLVPAPTQHGVSTDAGPHFGFYGTVSSTSGTELSLECPDGLYGVIASIQDGDTYIESNGIGLGTIAGLATSRTNALLAATVRPISDVMELDTILEYVPDSIASYLKWYVLRNIWSTDGESKDVARARYAVARIEELRNLISAINGEDIGVPQKR